jgi:hypothetical protein
MNYNDTYNNYGYNYDNNLKQFNSDEIIMPADAISLIRSSIEDENNDMAFYDNLIRKAPSQKEKMIIHGIRNDEEKHGQILRKIYYDFTKQNISYQTPVNYNFQSSSYRDDLEKALFSELAAVKKYRKILSVMNGDYYTLLMSIMTDENIHATKYNFLLGNQR